MVVQKKIILELKGNFDEGFDVFVSIYQDNQIFPRSPEIPSKLPSNSKINELLVLLQAGGTQEIHPRTDNNWGINNNRPTNYPTDEPDYRGYQNELKDELNRWLQSSPDKGYKQILNILENEFANKSTEFLLSIAISKGCDKLHGLPWNEWNLIKSNSNVVATHSFLSPNRELELTKIANKQVRILVVLGRNDGINVEQYLEKIKGLDSVYLKTLKQPTKKELIKELRQSEGWSIFYFAGHSKRVGETNQICINQTDELEISQLKNAFKEACRYGLKIVIFNSCDGLGLAKQLDQLYIPATIVMNGDVPDAAAHLFIEEFLDKYSDGKPLSNSFSLAQERLEELQDLLNANWSPKLFTHPDLALPPWQELPHQPQNKSQRLSTMKLSFAMLFLVSIIQVASQTPLSNIFRSFSVSSSSHHHSCEVSSITESNISAFCKAPNDSYKKKSIDVPGIQNNNGNLEFLASDTPNSFHYSCKEIFLVDYNISASCKAIDGSYKPGQKHTKN